MHGIGNLLSKKIVVSSFFILVRSLLSCESCIYFRFICSLYDPKKKNPSLPLSKRLMLMFFLLGVLFATHFVVFKGDDESVKVNSIKKEAIE
jgi:hypothetical protein